MKRPRLFLKTPSSARERAVFSPGKDGEAVDVGCIVDAAGCSQAKKEPLEARSSLQTEPVALIARVAELYTWIDGELGSQPGLAGQCQGCGRCCNFEAYDHRLFVTTPELLYFQHHLGARPVRAMTDGTCPYQEQGRCTIHTFRFAGCRIFCSHGSEEFQGALTERVLTRLKALCVEFELPYRYMDLKAALKMLEEKEWVHSSAH